METERGAIRADVVVDAGGMFAAEIGRMAGVTVPMIPIAHQYLVTEPIDGVTPELPQLRDPDNLVYFRAEVGGLVMGGYERNPAPWSLDGIPPDFNGKLLAPDWARFEEISAGAVRRVPAMADAGVKRLINGPEAFTPDNEFILGESTVGGFFVAAGFSAHGIAGAGGLGRQVAQWIVDGEPELDLWQMDIRRFGAQYRSRSYTPGAHHRGVRDLLRHPLPERGACRPAGRCASRPTYPRLVELGCAFGEKSGWERPNWFESNAADRRRAAAASRLGGRALVPGDRCREPRHPERRRALRRDQLCEDRDRRRRARSPSSSACATTSSTGRWAGSPTPRC